MSVILLVFAFPDGPYRQRYAAKNSLDIFFALIPDRWMAREKRVYDRYENSSLSVLIVTHRKI